MAESTAARNGFFGGLVGAMIASVILAVGWPDASKSPPTPVAAPVSIKWEEIESKYYGKMWRTKTPTGWLVVLNPESGRKSPSALFIPDLDHGWPEAKPENE